MLTNEEMKQLIYAIDRVKEFFKNEPDKTSLWFTLENPNLGNCTPLSFFFRGRGHKVVSFIEAALEENKGPNE